MRLLRSSVTIFGTVLAKLNSQVTRIPTLFKKWQISPNHTHFVKCSIFDGDSYSTLSIAAITIPQHFVNPVRFDSGYWKYLVRLQWADRSWFKAINLTCESFEGSEQPHNDGSALCVHESSPTGLNHTVNASHYLHWLMIFVQIFCLSVFRAIKNNQSYGHVPWTW